MRSLFLKTDLSAGQYLRWECCSSWLSRRVASKRREPLGLTTRHYPGRLRSLTTSLWKPTNSKELSSDYIARRVKQTNEKEEMIKSAVPGLTNLSPQ
jgi:hypothetical protein